jgi:arabinan endo-1,5-alpha-L-arabinosidase
MIQRELDGIYFRFSTGNGVNTMVSPSLAGPWVDWGAALPGGSSIQLEGVDSTDIWVCELYPDFNNMYL